MPAVLEADAGADGAVAVVAVDAAAQPRQTLLLRRRKVL
jgi:hypothetical protein